MSAALHQYLENTWALINEQVSDPNIGYIKKLFQQNQNKINIIDRAFNKIRSLKALPAASEDCAKLMIGILLAETLQENMIIPDEKQTLIFNAMLASLKENEKLIQTIARQLNIHNPISFPSKAVALIKLTLSLAAGAAALWFTGPYCALAARALFSAGYITLHGEPNWLLRYSYFIPAQEWIGNLAFQYGPKLLALPTGIISAKSVDATIHTLYRTQRMLTYFHNKTLSQNTKITDKCPTPTYGNLICFL